MYTHPYTPRTSFPPNLPYPIKGIGAPISEAQTEQLLEAFDTSGDGHVDRDEFGVGMAQMVPTASPPPASPPPPPPQPSRPAMPPASYLPVGEEGDLRCFSLSSLTNPILPICHAPLFPSVTPHLPPVCHRHCVPLSYVNSIGKAFEGGAVLIGLVILLCSGVWPYLEAIFLFIIWFYPFQSARARTQARCPHTRFFCAHSRDWSLYTPRPCVFDGNTTRFVLSRLHNHPMFF